MVDEDNMSGCMTGHMGHVQILPQQVQDFAIFHKTVGRDVVHARQAEGSSLLRDALQQKIIPSIRAYDRYRLILPGFESFLQGGRSACMIQMTMRQKDGLYDLFIQMLENILNIASRIDHNGTVLIIRENGAVLPQGRYRHPLCIQRSHSSSFQTVRYDVAIQGQPLRDKSNTGLRPQIIDPPPQDGHSPRFPSTRGVIMSRIIRTEPNAILSKAVEYHGFIFTQGVVAADLSKGIEEQTKSVLDQLDEILEVHGTDKTRILQAQIWVKDIADRTALNTVWSAWLPENMAPARACVQAVMADPKILVEIMLTTTK